MKRKHRLYVDVTFSKPVSKRDAAKGLSLKIDSMGYADNPVWLCDNSPYIDKIVIVERHK